MNKNEDSIQDSGSFRDCSGVVFWRNGKPFRQINPCYREQYQLMISSGLYKKLTDNSLLINHRETEESGIRGNAFLVIEPEIVPLISYPYEWCFGQIKDAALTTLYVQLLALEHDMILKDASAYNIQFIRGKAVHIDTLSFEFYREGMPWVAYGQFCRHFLAPLFLMAYIDFRLGQLLRVYIDGVPLDLASKLLKGKGGFSVKQHIHWHARSVVKHGQAGHMKKKSLKQIKISKLGMKAFIQSLISIIEKLEQKEVTTEWGDYYNKTNYSDSASEYKKQVVQNFINKTAPIIIWDFGANDGTYSRLALTINNSFVAAFDIDHVAVERNYADVKYSGENMLPLLLDLTNPSPGIGFAGHERSVLEKRQQPDCIIMLAVIHHLAISNNLPLEMIADWLQSLCKYLIIEFIPKTDSQVQVLLTTREDIFAEYNIEGFEKIFTAYFEILEKSPIIESERIIYLMKSKTK